jgi:hypothetical protein
MSEHLDRDDSKEGRPAPARRPRASILEVMGLVAALAVCLRWPGFSVPMGLLFLYARARRREVLRRPTRVALGQVAVAAYLPPAVGIFWTPLWRWDTYTTCLPLMPSFVPAALIMVLGWVVDGTRFSQAGPIAMVVLSLSPLVVIGGLGLVARRGIDWRIPYVILAAGMSAFSTFVFLVMFSIPT